MRSPDPLELESREARLIRPGSPFSLEWFDGQFGKERRFVHAAGSLVDIILKAKGRGAKAFIVSEDEIVSYEKAFEQALAVSSLLREKYRVSDGDRVGLSIKNCPEWAYMFFGVVLSRATPVLLTHQDPRAIAHCLNICNCKLMISDVEPRLLRSAGYEGPVFSLKESLDRTSAAATSSTRAQASHALPIDPTAEALITFTSGSTGLPKAVVSSHRAVITGLLNMALSAAMSATVPTDRSKSAGAPSCPLILLPLSYIGGYAQVLLATMFAGKFAVMTDASVLSTGAILNFVQLHGCTSIVGTNPTLASDLLRKSEGTGALDSLRSWNVSGRQIGEAEHSFIAQKFPHIALSAGYGLTETNGSISSIAGRALLDNPKSSGRVVPTAQIKIVGADDAPVEVDIIGRIHIKGPMMMDGYLTEDGEVQGSTDGWFATGDHGYLTPDKQLVLVSRHNDELCFKGRALSVTAVERYLIMVLGASEACLTKLLHCDGEERLGIAIILPSGESSDELAIKSKIRSEFGIDPEDLWLLFLADMPRTASGKVHRVQTAALFQSLGPPGGA